MSASAPAASPAPLAGLWEVPLFLLSVALLGGTVWIGIVLGPGMPGLAPPPAAAVPPPPSPERLLERAQELSAQGRIPEALEAVAAYRAVAADEAALWRADLVGGEVLEAAGDASSLALAVAAYRDLQGRATGEGDRASAAFHLGRARWRTFQADATGRSVAALQEILGALRESIPALGQGPLADEAAFCEGEVLQSMGRLDDAEAAYRRVGASRASLKASALMRIAENFRKRRALAEAHAAVMEAARRLGETTCAPWMPREVAAREAELLAQAWREAGDPGKALELEMVLQVLSGDPVEHGLHAAEIHEQWAERLSARAAASPDEASALIEQARCHHREAGRLCMAPVEAGVPGPYAELLFRAALAFERAGDVDPMVRALERFTRRYPDDARFPQAVHLLARHYRALGLYPRALDLFARTRAGMHQERGGVHYIPLSLYEEGLCEYLSGTPGSRARAREIFAGILEHPDIYPESQTWRDSLFALATLEYEDAGADPQGGARERASARLSEWLERYPADVRVPQARFMVGFLAWAAQDWPAAAAAFLAVAEGARSGGEGGQRLLGMGRTAALLAAEATYRQGLQPSDRARLAEARDRFAEARDLNLGTWGAPWALARMADCSRALGQPAEAARLYASARFEYGQIGASAGPAPEGTEGLETLIAWRAEVSRWLGRP